jgi:hypothetical protein
VTLGVADRLTQPIALALAGVRRGNRDQQAARGQQRQLTAHRISVSGFAEPSSACQKEISSAMAATQRTLRNEAARTAITIVAPE